MPGYISHHPDLKFSEIPDGVAAIGAVPGLGWAQILWFAGLLELGPFSVYNRREERPGAFNYFKWGGNDVGEAYPGLTDENRIQKLTIELQNGRLAMLAVTAYVIEEYVSGLPVVELTPWLFNPAYAFPAFREVLDSHLEIASAAQRISGDEVARFVEQIPN